MPILSAQLLGQSPEPSSASSPYHQNDGTRSDFDSSGTMDNSIDSIESTLAPTKVAATASRRLLDTSVTRTGATSGSSFNNSYVSLENVRIPCIEWLINPARTISWRTFSHNHTTTEHRLSTLSRPVRLQCRQRWRTGVQRRRSAGGP